MERLWLEDAAVQVDVREIDAVRGKRHYIVSRDARDVRPGSTLSEAGQYAGVPGTFCWLVGLVCQPQIHCMVHGLFSKDQEHLPNTRASSIFLENTTFTNKLMRWGSIGLGQLQRDVGGRGSSNDIFEV